LLKMITPVVNRNIKGAKGFAGVLNLLNEGALLLEETEKDALLDHFLRLDLPGNWGITTRAIFEGQAYFAERISNFSLEHAADWYPHLMAAPEPLYRLAYDGTCYAIGFTAAFKWFSLICSRALCSLEPQKTFERICFMLVVHKEEAARMVTTAEMNKFVHEQLKDIAFYSPLDGGIQDGHPIFSRTAYAIIEATNEGKFDPVSLFCKPHVLEAIKIPGLNVPVIFRPEETRRIDMQTPGHLDRDELMGYCMLGALGQQLTRPLAAKSHGIGEGVLQRLSWLVGDHAQVQVRIPLRDIVRGNIDPICTMFDPDQQPLEKSKLWGRLVLVLVDENDTNLDTLLPHEPLARTYIQRVAERIPMFPAYLAPHFGLYDWFGCTAPPEARVGNDVEMGHPAMQAQYEQFIRALEAHAQRNKLNSTLVPHCLIMPALTYGSKSMGTQ
jgi:hypothetical protein